MSDSKAASESYSREAIVAMLLFSLAASSLLLVNKMVMHAIPLPSFVSTLQFVVTAIASYTVMWTGHAPIEKWEWPKVKAYLYYVGLFVGAIYCNMKALQYSNVETVIVFRACCPIVVSLIDWAFLGRMLPSARSWLALAVLLGGCLGYVLTDRAFSVSGYAAYTWVTAYFLIISVEMAYGKHIVGPQLGFASMWGPTLYTNAISTPVMAAIGLVTHEPDKLAQVEWTAATVSLLALSCVIGVAISFLGWRARSLISATCYTVLGVANKMATVMANALLWDQHASVTGVFFLMVCLGGAAGFQQAPMADETTSSNKDASKRRLVLGGAGALAVLGGVLVLLFSTAAPLNAAPPTGDPTLSPTHGAHDGAHYDAQLGAQLGAHSAASSREHHERVAERAGASSTGGAPLPHEHLHAAANHAANHTAHAAEHIAAHAAKPHSHFESLLKKGRRRA